MKDILLVLAVCTCVLTGCEKDTFHDTGTANGVFEGSLYEYLKSDPKNYDSLVMMIDRAGLVELIAGRDADFPEITFFAPKNMNIIRYLWETTDEDGNRLYNRVADVPEAECREIVLSYIVVGKHKREDFGYEVKGTLEGGTLYSTLTDLKLRAYRTKGSWNGITDAGADGIGIHFKASGHIANVATGDLCTDNAVVHALSSTFALVNPIVKPIN